MSATSPGCGLGHHELKRLVEFGDLLAEQQVAVGDAAQRSLGRGNGVGEVWTGTQPGGRHHQLLARQRPQVPRSGSGALTTKQPSWLPAAVRAFIAPRRATRSARIASTRPSRPLGIPVAVPANAARAAASASRGSDLPLVRLVRRSGR
jgi:hypothetical protein